MAREILFRGHELGCHGYSLAHDPYDTKDFGQVENDVEKGTRAIRSFCDINGFRSPYFRPHKKLASILENFDYLYDSSVAARRFDMFMGRTNNPRNLLNPMKPYHPSNENIFKKGESEIVEIPLSGFIFPLLGVVMRNFGLGIFTRFIDFLNLLTHTIVFDIHVWEFGRISEGPYRHKRYRHRRKSGRETIFMLDALLRHLEYKGTFVMLSDLLR